MKKKSWILLIALFLLIPNQVKAINHIYMDATVNLDGSLTVKEIIDLGGDFNGFNRTIAYANSSATAFDADALSYGGSDIYNGSAITFDKIGAVDSTDFTDLDIEVFKETSSASSGNYGVYTETCNTYDCTATIYLPSSYNQYFYIEYTITDMAVLWNDGGELGWNIGTGGLEEDTNEIDLTVHVPYNDHEIRAWGHGTYTADIIPVDNQTINFNIRNIDAYQDISVRMFFDREAVIKASKVESIDALDKILVYEEAMANEANQARTRARIIVYIVTALFIALIVGYVFFIRSALKQLKAVKPHFTAPYFRDLPDNYNPAMVQYLMEKNVDDKAFGASILNLVEDGYIKIEDYQAKDPIFINTHKTGQLSASDEEVMTLLFTTVGKDDKVSLNAIKKSASNDYSSFLSQYHNWSKAAINEGVQANFFTGVNETFLNYNTMFLFLALIGFGCLLVYNSNIITTLLSLILIIATFFFQFYLAKHNTYTVDGIEHYAKWSALKQFLKDFGNFKARDLPQLTLWSKYLIYASVFGFADKLAKTMKIKATELSATSSDPHLFDHYYAYMHINHIVNSGITSATHSAQSAYNIAHSSNSSGSGFGGGGFSGSSGGGSFGGGGGGGRF